MAVDPPNTPSLSRYINVQYMSSSNINTRGRNSPPPGFHHDEFPAQPFHMVRVSCDWVLIDKKIRIQVLCKLFREWISLLYFLWRLSLKLHFDTYSKTQPRINLFSSYISPLTTLKISLVILLTIWYAVLLMLVWRIWCWINLQSPSWYVSLFLLFDCMLDIVLIFWGKFHLGHSQKF